MIDLSSCDRVRGVLETQERWWQIRVWIGLLAGVLLTLAVPTVLTALFCAIARWLLGVHWSAPWVFLIVAAIAVPSLFRLELRKGRRYLAEATEGAQFVGLSTRLPLWAGGMGGAWIPAAANARAEVGVIVEFLLVGPRLMVDSVRQWRHRRRIGRIDVSRAAEILCVLRAEQDGVYVTQLQGPTESVDALGPVLGWLVFRGWIGVRDTRDYVYLYSDARRRLERAAEHSVL